ncbi:CBS domain-containing protein [Desulfohalobiaceae bacterium Ax17]|jgi:acetoin utilization protein AcuB|uniref:CBS domain-containing protein n=1 Tax=Desulfovulcanus ferrireducens TaxID=2831190 RepID=UPI00207BC598|nr:CBS domain-containing protein [Desulfovulcanus ferrireducens]MBT8763202.1 CBS domain-containing protein [Desulfovulcanus ferrireducens]
MYVGLRMITNVPTVSPDDLVLDADKIMEENKLWMLLVTQKDKLIGYIRKEDARAALPSLATSLDKHEMNFLLTKLTVEKIIRTDLETVSPETEIEVAANLMYKKNLPGLAVVNKKNKLLGYINRSVMLKVLVDEMGLEQGGTRIAFEVEDRTGVIAEVSTIIASMGINIISTGTFFRGKRRLVVFRVKTDDPTAIENELKKRNYRLVTPEDFAGEWE